MVKKGPFCETRTDKEILLEETEFSLISSSLREADLRQLFGAQTVKLSDIDNYCHIGSSAM